jgi:predicted nucleotidyltransferase
MGSRLDYLRSNRETIRSIAARHNALSISVFGSVARGEDSPDSDYDFLVEFQKGSTLIDLSGLMIELEDFLKTPVDVVSIGGLKPRDQQIRQEAVLL